MTAPVAGLEEALRDSLERLVRFHGERPWTYSDVTTAAGALALIVQETQRRQMDLAVGLTEGSA